MTEVVWTNGQLGSGNPPPLTKNTYKIPARMSLVKVVTTSARECGILEVNGDWNDLLLKVKKYFAIYVKEVESDFYICVFERRVVKEGCIEEKNHRNLGRCHKFEVGHDTVLDPSRIMVYMV